MNRPPAFQFYPKDWNDFKVQRMSYEAQGIYMKILCFMWNDSRDQCSMPNDDAIISKSLGITKKRWMRIKEEIFYKNDPIFLTNGDRIISKRLKKEIKKIRTYRKLQAEKGKLSGEKRRKLKRTTVEPRLNRKATGRQPEGNSSSSSSSSLKDIYTPQFKKFWAEYPNKKEKDVAFAVFKNLKKEEQEQVIMAARNYRIETEREKQEKKFIKHPATFLRKNRWRDHLGSPEKEEMEKFDEIQDKAMEERK